MEQKKREREKRVVKKRREWNRREESGKEEKSMEENRVKKKQESGTEENGRERVWKRREQNGRDDFCNKYGCRTVCALDTCQSSLHVLVTVCAVTGCLYAGVRRSAKDKGATLEFWALQG